MPRAHVGASCLTQSGGYTTPMDALPLHDFLAKTPFFGGLPEASMEFIQRR